MKSTDEIEALRAKFKSELDTADWQMLKPHQEREAIIVVSEELDLVDAAVRIATDDFRQVQEWIGDKSLAKPTREQLLAWESDDKRPFHFLIVQPYVLIQSKGS